MGDARLAAPDYALTRSWDVAFVAPEAGEDLERTLRRSGFSDVQLAYVQRGWAGAEGEALRNIDAEAALEEIRDRSNGVGDWRILDGYDRLLEHMAAGLTIHLNTEVEHIDWRGPGVRVTATNGAQYDADRVIITLPLGVLQAGRVRFTPALPAAKQDAIDRLAMGPVIKLVYRFAEPVLPEGRWALASAGNPCMWWSPSFGQPSDEYVLTAFVTADRARELLALGETAALEKGVEALRVELNAPTLRPLAAKLVNWVDDPYALGGYSVTPPGAKPAHAALAEPTDARLYWAGEATAGHLWKATVHGAYASGCRAAAEVLSAPYPKKDLQEV